MRVKTITAIIAAPFLAIITFIILMVISLVVPPAGLIILGVFAVSHELMFVVFIILTIMWINILSAD